MAREMSFFPAAADKIRVTFGIGHFAIRIKDSVLTRHSDPTWLASRLRRCGREIALSVIFATVSGVLSTIDPLLMRRLIDHALPDRRLVLTLVLTGTIGGCFLGRHIFLGLSRSLDFDVEQAIAQDLRVSILEQFNRFSPEYHEQTPVGEKLKRLEGDVDQIAELGSEISSAIVRSTVFFAINLIVMVLLSVHMTIALVPALGLFIWVWLLYRSRLVHLSDQARAETGRVSSILVEFLSAQPQIQLLCSQKIVEKKAVAVWTTLIRSRRVYRQAEIRLMVAIGALFVLGNLAVLTVGGLQVLSGTLTIGGLVAFYGFTTRTFEPVSIMLDIYTRMQRVGASIRQVRSVLESTPTVADGGTISEPLASITQGIALRQITFSYKEDRQALRTFTLAIGPLDRVGIVGPSGSGKSTIARLITRMSEPDCGTIVLDGRTLNEYKLDALRHTISYVPQQPVLFQGTIRDNLLYGNPQATQDDIDQVVAVAQLTTLLRHLPAGLETELGPNGRSLSGGELQRIALARALLRRSAVLILDESTSAVDLLTEERILRAVAGFCSQSVLIIISHRLPSISWMDRIVVLEAGRIVGMGAHEELFSLSAFYRKLYSTHDHVVH